MLKRVAGYFFSIDKLSSKAMRRYNIMIYMQWRVYNKFIQFSNISIRM